MGPGRGRYILTLTPRPPPVGNVRRGHVAANYVASERRGSERQDLSQLIEVALPSVIGGHLAYNWSRLPKHTPGKPFYIDLIFSRTPLTKDDVAPAPEASFGWTAACVLAGSTAFGLTSG